MNKLNLIVLSAFVGGVLGFSFWPVVSGVDTSKPCNEMVLHDCALPNMTTARVVYLAGGQSFDYPGSGFNSRAEYCDVTKTCRSETVAVPSSLLVGAATGALVGYAISFVTPKKRGGKV